MIENGTLLQDRYLIERQIGAGGMGAVYLAVDRRFGSYVAIKETFYKNDELGEAFEREAHLLNSLLHPVLPHVSDFFTENNGHFLVMQYIEGEDLSEILKREGAFPVRDVLRWTDSLLDALDYLHSQEPPIIHRDIKPQNLKITPRGDVILLDFGLAKMSSEDTTNAKSIFGYSRKYSPLEQIQGTGTDSRSDIFALAATSYHLLTGKPPLDALRRASAIIAGNADPLPQASELNSEIPVEVAAVLNSALALNPAQRFASAKAMRQALEHAVKLTSSETAEELPKVAPATDVGGAIVNSVETEDFPALESFADEVKNPPQNNDTERVSPVEVSAPIVNISLLPAPELTQATSVVEVPTKVSPVKVSPSKFNRRPNYSRFPIAAAVLLLCVGLAAGYFIYSANRSTEANQTTVSEQQEESAQTALASEAPPEVSGSPLAENVEQAGAKPAVIKTTTEKRTAVEKQKTVEEPIVEIETLTTEASKPAPAKAENSRPEPPQNKRRGEPQNNGETRNRVVKSQPAPDIESIFTGRTAEQRDEIQQRREERRRQREQMTEEEWREMRRQRREERRRRQNSQPFPF